MIYSKNSYSRYHKENIIGYNLNKELFIHNQQDYYIPQHTIYLISEAGTHNLRDWRTDIYLKKRKIRK